MITEGQSDISFAMSGFSSYAIAAYQESKSRDSKKLFMLHPNVGA